MSRAFVTETAPSAPPPERMIDDGPNPVTPEGLARINLEVARLEAALKAGPDVLAREMLERDLRYWMARRATAELAPPPSGDAVQFGSRVTIARKGREQTFRIVGVDEADPARGLISVHSPLAQAVIGARIGDIVEAKEPLGEIEIRALPAC